MSGTESGCMSQARPWHLSKQEAEDLSFNCQNLYHKGGSVEQKPLHVILDILLSMLVLTSYEEPFPKHNGSRVAETITAETFHEKHYAKGCWCERQDPKIRSGRIQTLVDLALTDAFICYFQIPRSLPI